MNLYLSLLQVNRFRPNVLILVCKFISVWIVLTIRSDDTIAVEVVVRRVMLVVIATIGIFRFNIRFFG